MKRTKLDARVLLTPEIGRREFARLIGIKHCDDWRLRRIQLHETCDISKPKGLVWVFRVIPCKSRYFSVRIDLTVKDLNRNIDQFSDIFIAPAASAMRDALKRTRWRKTLATSPAA